MDEDMLVKKLQTDDGAREQLNFFADESKCNAQIRLALQLMYNIQREKHSPEMAYTRTLLYLNWKYEYRNH